MTFRIHAANPRFISGVSGSVEDLSAAIEAVFPMDTEDAVVHWGQHSAPFEYKYDLSVVADDIIPVLEWLHGRPNDRALDFNFASNTFNADWHIDRPGTKLVVTAHWRWLAHDLEKVFNLEPVQEVDTGIFIDDWRRVLAKAVDAIDASNLVIDNRDMLLRCRAIVTGSTRSA